MMTGRRAGKLTLNDALTGREGGRQRSMAAMKRKQDRARAKAMGGSAEREKVFRDVSLPESDHRCRACYPYDRACC